MYLFKIRMKTFFRNKTIIFWSLIFPIVLATFFSIAFKNLTSNEMFESINIAVVENVNLTDEFTNVIKGVEINNEKKMFNVKLVSEEEALTLLEKNNVNGVIEVQDNNKVILKVNRSGLNQTITKTFLDEYLQTTSAVMDLVVLSENNPEAIYNDIMNNVNYIDEVSSSRNKSNIVLIFYFSLIGMALIYGGFWGTDNILNLQANMSGKGVRIAVSPVNRLKMLLIYTLCAFLIHIMIIILLLFYMIVILKIDFADKLPLIFLVCVLGSLVGISFGSFISIALKKAKEGTKIMITTLVGVVGGFFSGLMMVEMKYIVQTKFPILSYINPVAVITDALHSINYFGVTSRFYLNIAILTIMIFVFTIGTYVFYRRDSYESI